MKLSEDINMETQFCADLYERTDSAGYGSLYIEIEQAKRNIEYYKNMYTAELDGIPKRISYMRSSMVINIVVLVLLILFKIMFSGVIKAGGGMLLRTFVGWLAIGVIYIGIIYMVIRCAKAVRIYLINVVPDKFNNYIQTHGIHNIVEEKQYCEGVLKHMLEYERIVNKIEKDIKSETVKVDMAHQAIDAMNFDIKDFKYNAGRLDK